MDSPDGMYAGWRWPSSVSPLVDDGLLKEIRAREEEGYFRREYLAEWTDNAGAYFTEAELTAAVGGWPMVQPTDAAQLGVVAGGVDWGYANDSNTLAVVAARAERDGRGGKRFWVPFVAEEFRKPYAEWIDDLVGMTAVPGGAGGFRFGRLVAEGNGVGAMPSQVLQARLSELGVPGVVEVVMTDLRLKETSFGVDQAAAEAGPAGTPVASAAAEAAAGSVVRAPAGGWGAPVGAGAARARRPGDGVVSGGDGVHG